MSICGLFKRERKELVQERDNLKAEEGAELKQMVQDNVKKVRGKTISEEDSETLSEHLQESDEFRDMYVNRSSVHDEVEILVNKKQELGAVLSDDSLTLEEINKEVAKIQDPNIDNLLENEATNNEEMDSEMAALLAAMEEEEAELLHDTENTLDASMRAKSI